MRLYLGVVAKGLEEHTAVVKQACGCDDLAWVQLEVNGFGVVQKSDVSARMK